MDTLHLLQRLETNAGIVVAVVALRWLLTVPHWLPFVGNALPFGRDPNAFVRSCQRRCGPFFRTLIGGKRMVFVVRKSHFAALLKAPELSFQTVADEISLTFLLNGADGVAPLVASSIAQLVPAMDRMPLNTPLPLFSTLARLAFGSTVASLAFDASFPLLVAGVPSLFVRKAIAARARLNEHLGMHMYAAALIQERNDMFRAFAASSKVPMTAMGGDQLGILWASVANSIPSLFWLVYYLLKDRDAWAAIRTEIDTHLPLDPNEWTRNNLGNCALLDSAIDESLSLAATSMLMRDVTKDCAVTVDASTTLRFRKGDKVVMYPSLSHYDEKVFEYPDKFRVDRFLNAGAAQRSAFMPFDRGKSMCPGRIWAKAQLKTAVALLIRRVPNTRLVDPTVPVGFDLSRLGLGVYPPDSDRVQFVFIT
ncbi:cytochrome P450 [Chytriomyces sp. MP71]|nr:cytochrome P450 [Chytriomyces sp. MP71]